MSIEVINRTKTPHERTIYNAYGNTRPQISYNSEGRITIRIIHGEAEHDTLIVLDRPLTASLIHFVKNGIVELPTTQGYCKECATSLHNGDLPY